MEAVQQKVALSQQLDQWQQDVQELLSENMSKKMAANKSRSGAESDSSQPEKRKSSRIMSFLKLGSAWHQHQRHHLETEECEIIPEEEGGEVVIISRQDSDVVDDGAVKSSCQESA